MKSKTAWIIAAVLALTVFGSGCSALRNQPGQVQYYTISYKLEHLPDNTTTYPSMVLEVSHFDSSEPYRSRQIVYADNQYRRKTYVYHKWLLKPADMVRENIIRDLRAANIAGAVIGNKTGLKNPTHVLKASLEKFYEDDTNDPWQAVLTLTVTLASGPGTDSGTDILLHKTYETVKQMDQNNPTGLASAMSSALAVISKQLTADIMTAVKKH